MAQQDQLGPFSEYLTKPAAAAMAPMPVPQVTGLESTGAAIGNIALNFINGIRQGRAQKYAMQEAENQKDIARYEQALKMVSASGLPDQQKRLLEAKLTAPLIRNIAGDKNATSKQTGNPMTDIFKNMALGMVGGNLPKKGERLSMEPVVEAITMANDPSLSKTKLASDLDREARLGISDFISKAREKGEPLSYESFQTGEIGKFLNGILTRASELGVPAPPSIQRIGTEWRTRTAAEDEAIKKSKETQEARGGLGRGIILSPTTTTPTIAPQAPATAPIPGTSAVEPKPALEAQPLPAQPPPAVAPLVSPSATPSAGPSSLDVPLDQAQQYHSLAQKAGEKGLGFIEDIPKPYIVGDKRVNGQYFKGKIDGTVQAGIYVPDEQKLYTSGFRQPSKYDEKPLQEDVDKVYSSLVTAAKNIIKNPETLKELESTLGAFKQSGNIADMNKAFIGAQAAQRKAIDSEARAEISEAKDKRKKEDALDRYANNTISNLQSDPFVKEYRSLRAKLESIKGDFDLYYQHLNASKDPNLSPEERRKSLERAKSQAVILDNSLVSASATFADPKTGVREPERAIWTQLSGPYTELIKKIKNVAGDMSNKMTMNERDAVNYHLRRIIDSYDKGISELKRDRSGAIMAAGVFAGVDPDELKKRVDDSFKYITIGGVGTEATPSIPARRLKTSGTTTPPAGGKPAGLEAFKHLNPEAKVQ